MSFASQHHARMPGTSAPGAGPFAATAPATSASSASSTGDDPFARYWAARKRTLEVVEHLSPEDTSAAAVVHGGTPSRPAKWHLGRTSYYFEKHLVERFSGTAELARVVDAGVRGVFADPKLSGSEPMARPSLDQILIYRETIDRLVFATLNTIGERDHDEALRAIDFGIDMEHRHREMMLGDLKLLLWRSPDGAVFPGRPILPHDPATIPARPLHWAGFEEGLYEVGTNGTRYSREDEHPRHNVYLQGFELADRLVTNGEYQAFIEDGGYVRRELWLEDGWLTLQREGWRAPLYWRRARDHTWLHHTLRGESEVDPSRPVNHVSLYEADAYARWFGARLPNEAEWEAAVMESCGARPDGRLGGDETAYNLLERDELHPEPAGAGRGLQQMFGDTWEWTRSTYGPYPGYRPGPTPPGEAVWPRMSGRVVLRGGSCITARDQVRATSRAALRPDDRWMYTGIRLARDGR